MRVLFIQTPSVEAASQERVYPLGIVALAGSLQGKGYEVGVLDMNIERDPFGAVKKRLLSFRPDVVGLSLRNIDPLANKTSSLVPPFLVTAKMVAAVLPKSLLIAGGTGFSLFPARLMHEAPEIHYGIVGEAEASLPTFLASVKNPPPVKGLCLRKGRSINVVRPSRSVDMVRYAPPDRKILDPALYSGINSYVPAVGVESKRGCPFRCAYCVYPKLQGKRPRCRSPLEVVNEIEFLKKEHGVERVHFTDPVVNFPRGHLEDICRELLRRRLKVKWDGFMREDCFDSRNAALFEKAGCECFSFSPDGLCQEGLDVLGKGMTERDILRAATLAAETGVMSVYHFMVNIPGETERTCEKGIRLLEKIYGAHFSRKNLGTVVLNNIRILPGTAIEGIARQLGVIGPDTDLLYPTYFNPKPFDTLRYRLEALHLEKNVFMWQEVRKHEDTTA